MKIDLLRKIASGEITAQEAFAEPIDLKVCSVDMLNWLLGMKKKYQPREEFSAGDKELATKFMEEYEQRKNQSRKN